MTDLSDDLVDFNEDASLERPEVVYDDGDEVAFHQGHVLAHLSDLARVAIESDDSQKVGRVLVALDGIAARLNGSGSGTQKVYGHRDEVELHLQACLDGRAETEVTTGGWRLHLGWTTPRKGWKWDELATALLPKIRMAPRLLSADSEVEDDTARAWRLLRACLSMNAGKVTGLRDLGLDPDEFCEKSPSVRTIERHRTDPTTKDAF